MFGTSSRHSQRKVVGFALYKIKLVGKLIPLGKGTHDVMLKVALYGSTGIGCPSASRAASMRKAQRMRVIAIKMLLVAR
jgi:hypothetical protein